MPGLRPRHAQPADLRWHLLRVSPKTKAYAIRAPKILSSEWVCFPDARTCAQTPGEEQAMGAQLWGSSQPAGGEQMAKEPQQRPLKDGMLGTSRNSKSQASLPLNWVG